MINTVIFDLDGLLIDSETISYQMMNDLSRPYGHENTLAYYAENYSGRTLRANMEGLIEQFSLPITLEEACEFIYKTEPVYFAKGVPLKPGAEELLQYLTENHYRILLATSSIRSRAFSVLDPHGITSCFYDFVMGPDVSRGKPFPDIFLKACEKAGRKPEECLVLEDSEAGVRASAAAGIKVICVPDIKRPCDETLALAEAVYSSLYSVIDYLKAQ